VNVLMTGPTGCASAIAAPALLAAGHRVSGLARSEGSAGTLKESVHRGRERQHHGGGERGEGVAPEAGPLIGLDVPGVVRRCPVPAQNPDRRWSPKPEACPTGANRRRWRSTRKEKLREPRVAPPLVLCHAAARYPSWVTGSHGKPPVASKPRNRSETSFQQSSETCNLPVSVLSSLSGARAW
jgi:nucleoside-diphosphate-sugar epimerase